MASDDSSDDFRRVPNQERVEIDGNTLVVTVDGNRPTSDAEALDNILARWARVAEFAAANRITKILYITTVTGSGSSRVTHSLFSQFDRFGFDPHLRLAIVRADTKTRRLMQLGIEVARADGWDFQIFATADEGRAWLQGLSVGA